MSLQWKKALRAIVALLFSGGAVAGAQGVEISAGSSTLLSADGVTVTHFFGDRESIVSVGRNGSGFVMGGATEFHRPNGWTRYGDTAMSFVLPTDFDGASRGVGARGVDWKQTGEAGAFHVFAGKTGNPLGFGYLRSVDPQRWGAALEWTRGCGPRLRIGALTAFGAAHAGLVTTQYQLRPRMEVEAAGGWNAGRPVLVLAAKAGGDSWTLRGSRTFGRLQLRPETAVIGLPDQARIPERAGTNLAFTKALGRVVSADAERVEYGKDELAGLPDGAVLHEAGVSAHQGAWAGGVRGFASQDGSNAAKGLAGLVAWNYGPWRLETAIAESRRMGSAGTLSVMGQGGYDVAGRVRISAGADWEGSGPGFVGGVEVHARWGAVHLSERVVYVPFGTTAGFTKVTEVGVLLHPKGVETSFETLVGKGIPWTYTALGEKFVETGGPAGSSFAAPGARSDVALPKYVVRGRVVDAQGHPVASAAVRVGSDTVWTDSDGVWEARQRRADAVSVALSEEGSLTGVKFVPMGSGSMTVVAAEDALAEPVNFVVAPCHGPCAVAKLRGVPEHPAGDARATLSVRNESGDVVDLVRQAAPKVWHSIAAALWFVTH